jgi:hypothetical protein
MAQLVEQKTGKTRKSTSPLPADGYASNTKSDDMSPQSTPYTSHRESSFDREIPSQEPGQHLDGQDTATETRRSPYRTFDRTPLPHTARDDSGDMSPISGGSESPYPRESAWDRIRREAASGQSQSQSPSTTGSNVDRRQAARQKVTSGDSFTFSATDEERQLAKQEAQKDFDARLEKERQGRDFEEGSVGRKW